jgi:hypothetical protein
MTLLMAAMVMMTFGERKVMMKFTALMAMIL